MKLDDGHEALLVDGGGIDGGKGAYLANRGRVSWPIGATTPSTAATLMIEVGEVRDRGDFVFAAIRARGHGAGSQLPFEDTVWHASRWRRGKCIWWRICPTWAEALEAAGLRE